MFHLEHLQTQNSKAKIKIKRHVPNQNGQKSYFTFVSPTISYDILFLKFECTNLNRCKILQNKFLTTFRHISYL